MRRHSGLVVLSALLACQGAAKPVAAPAPVPMPARPFADYLAQAQAGDTTLDFQAFRLSYTTTALYAPYGMHDKGWRDSLFAAANREDFTGALAWADTLLRNNPVDAEAHAVAGFASASLHDSLAAEHHYWLATGLVLSIGSSGAATEASPLLVISVAEEYTYAQYIKLRRAGTQGLGECNGRPCDNVQFTSRAGSDTTLFFDVSIPVAHLQRSFQK